MLGTFRYGTLYKYMGQLFQDAYCANTGNLLFEFETLWHHFWIGTNATDTCNLEICCRQSHNMTPVLAAPNQSYTATNVLAAAH